MPIFQSHTQPRLARGRVLRDLKSLAQDAEAFLRSSASEVGDMATQTRESLLSSIEKAKETYEELSEQGVQITRDAAKQTDVAIRTHPYEAVGIAFGVGVLVGVLFKSGR
jgi:ElaB/YqjD/DUF883 family membrane-anchored ribosome-binding protein